MILQFIGAVVVIIFIVGFIEGCIDGHNRAIRDIKKEQEEKSI